MENETQTTTKENELTVIVKESGLDTTKAKYILDKFQDSFELADEWTKKAKAIIVTRDDQKAEMAMAKVGRLALRNKRIEIEKSRKELKEQALREGKAIDGIANVLKALFVPIEEYLDSQERFTEIKAEKEVERLRLEYEKKAEEDRIAKEKADASELERLRIENEKQKKEAAEKEKALHAERQKAEAERRKQEELLFKQKSEAESKAREEKAKQDAILKAEKEKAEAQMKVMEGQARKQREEIQIKAEAERKEKERLSEILKNQVECPHCGHKFQINRT